MLNIELLRKICNTPGVSGFEEAIRSLIISEISNDVDELKVDPLGNIIAIKKGNSRQKLLFTAHMDEIGFMVQHIDDEGFIRFIPLGGFDPKTLSAQRVIIHGKKDIIGVMGSKPIHIMSQDERNKATQLKDFFIDTGLSKEEVLEQISIGDPITRDRDLIQMGKCINAKSLDNRISVYILIELIKKVKSSDLDLYFAFTVQEELGLRGAKTAAFSIGADYAINVDTTIAFDVPGAQAHENITKLGHGVAIKIFDSSVMPDSRMIKFLKDCAKDIKWQAEILTGGGTDTASVQLAGHGAISGAISIPTRNIHQVIEMVHEEDCIAAINILEKAIDNINLFNLNYK
ncbi:MAG TPA: M42 family metallopeptidase [Saprospiraceae bacterium]|jgi:endoglucanase|nr:M42 family metallopeptidase [Saprospiraceae bacterium]